MKRLTKEVKEEIQLLLPVLRTEVKKEIKSLGAEPPAVFYSDEALLDVLPVATYEYMILKKGIRLDYTFIIYALNMGTIKELHVIMAHALRKLGLSGPSFSTSALRSRKRVGVRSRR